MKAKRLIPLVATLLGLFLVVFSASSLFREHLAEQRVRELGRIPMSAPSISLLPHHDFDELHKTNEDIVAWATVKGTNIDTPVVQGDYDYYLKHDISGMWCQQGTPVLDRMCEIDDMHTLVYGHHIANTDYAFSQLADAWTEEGFSRIEEMLWDTEEGACFMKPVCALKVDKWNMKVQTTGFKTQENLAEWLISLSEDADVRAEGYESLCAGAKRVVSLVTCTENIPNQRWRGVVVFVETDSDN